jgi:xanthine dehydrogenase accessory factor
MNYYQQIVNLQSKGARAAICTIVNTQGSTPRRTGSKMLVLENGEILGTVGGGEMESRVIQAALTAIQTGKSNLISYTLNDPTQGDPGLCGGTLEVYVEPITPKPTVIVVGMGHVGQAVAYLAHWMGYRVEVADDREEFISPEIAPYADAYHSMPLTELPTHTTIHNQTYIVMTTRNIKIDTEGLPALVESEAAYIGVIGSRKRWLATQKKLLKAGIAEENINKIISPMGLELNAETPEEIAVSILAEITMLRMGGDGKRMKA